MLLVIVLMLALAIIAMSATAPYVVTEIKRDREEELIHRGKQYQRAVKLFYKRFGRYPLTLEELQNTQNLRFLRKQYKDPMTPDGEWRILHLGEAKYFPKGFGYASISGASPLGGAAGGGMGGAVLPGGVSGILGGSGAGASGQPGQPGSGGMTPAGDISKPLGTGPVINAPIIGVASKNKDASIHEVNERKHYNEWEFFYDPRYDIAAMMPGTANVPVRPGGSGGQGGFGMPAPQPGGSQKPQ